MQNQCSLFTFINEFENVMENLDLNSIDVHDLNLVEMRETTGGQDIGFWLHLAQVLEYTIAAGKEYVKYSAATGGEYVIHHAY
jgi:hypothetical protein